VARLTSLFEVSQSARPFFLLGAGASYRSGVPLAADATDRIAREAYARQRLGTNAIATVKPSDYMRFCANSPGSLAALMLSVRTFHWQCDATSTGG